ncbi:hypothetical protein TMatcc_009806 [Talaromyces marneffei ATCC 18224]
MARILIEEHGKEHPLVVRDPDVTMSLKRAVNTGSNGRAMLLKYHKELIAPSLFVWSLGLC